MPVEQQDFGSLERGLDALEVPLAPKVSRGRRWWKATWPKLLAVAIFFGIWQLVFWSGWKPEYALPSPEQTLSALWNNWDVISEAMWTTLQRALKGYLLAIAVGVAIGAAVARIPLLRAAVGSMITGLQTMPSVAWYPMAVVLFKYTEGAIFFVVVVGAAPSIANGLISGIDNVNPVLLRAGKVLGARRFDAFRWVILPAALPTFLGGLKQGWAFAWRSLLAGEIIGGIAGFSLGQQLAVNRDNLAIDGLYATMIVLFVIGVVVDAAVFGTIDRKVRKRYGLIDAAAS